MIIKLKKYFSKTALIAVLLVGLWSCGEKENAESGDSYYKSGQYEQAIEAYTQELSLKPTNVQLLYNRGRAYEELNNYDAAINDFQAALKQDDRNVKVLISLGDVLYKQDKFDNALFYYQQATDYGKNNALAHFKEGRAHHKLGNVKEAMDKYGDALREDAQLGEAYLYRGALKVSQKNNRSACEDFRKASAANVEGAAEALAKYCN